MEKYEDKIYSLGEAVTGQTQAMSQAVQKTLENNGGDCTVCCKDLCFPCSVKLQKTVSLQYIFLVIKEVSQ